MAQQLPFKIRKLDKVNVENFKNDIKDIDWSFLWSLDLIDEVWNTFKNRLLKILDHHAPLKVVNRKVNEQPWMDKHWT